VDKSFYHSSKTPSPLPFALASSTRQRVLQKYNRVLQDVPSEAPADDFPYTVHSLNTFYANDAAFQGFMFDIVAKGDVAITIIEIDIHVFLRSENVQVGKFALIQNDEKIVPKLRQRLLIKSFKLYIEVWTRDGTWDGFEDDPSSWTMNGCTVLNASNTGLLVPTRIDPAYMDWIHVNPGSQTAVYTAIPVGNQHYSLYDPMDPSKIYVSGDILRETEHLQLLVGAGKSYYFGISTFRDRLWNGGINYVLGKPQRTTPQLGGADCRPSTVPSLLPTDFPSLTNEPSSFPTRQDSVGPSTRPSISPSVEPSQSPTLMPSLLPTLAPTIRPSFEPTSIPTVYPSLRPSFRPTIDRSIGPTFSPTSMPSILGSHIPSFMPSLFPSTLPSIIPSRIPSSFPSDIPSLLPSEIPSLLPSSYPSKYPSTMPTPGPSSQPTPLDYTQPPTTIPTKSPSALPSTSPTSSPTHVPSFKPTMLPTKMPTSTPSETPSTIPTATTSLANVGMIAAVAAAGAGAAAASSGSVADSRPAAENRSYNDNELNMSGDDNDNDGFDMGDDGGDEEELEVEAEEEEDDKKRKSRRNLSKSSTRNLAPVAAAAGATALVAGTTSIQTDNEYSNLEGNDDIGYDTNPYNSSPKKYAPVGAAAGAAALAAGTIHHQRGHDYNSHEYDDYGGYEANPYNSYHKNTEYIDAEREQALNESTFMRSLRNVSRGTSNDSNHGYYTEKAAESSNWQSPKQSYNTSVSFNVHHSPNNNNFVSASSSSLYGNYPSYSNRNLHQQNLNRAHDESRYHHQQPSYQISNEEQYSSYQGRSVHSSNIDVSSAGQSRNTAVLAPRVISPITISNSNRKLVQKEKKYRNRSSRNLANTTASLRNHLGVSSNDVQQSCESTKIMNKPISSLQHMGNESFYAYGYPRSEYAEDDMSSSLSSRSARGFSISNSSSKDVNDSRNEWLLRLRKSEAGSRHSNRSRRDFSDYSDTGYSLSG